MSELRTRAWMDAWAESDFESYSAAWHEATAISDDSGERSREWLRLVLAAAEDGAEWASDVLADMQRRGALESWKAAPVVPLVKNKRGRSLTTRAAAKRRADDGESVAFVQESLFDLSDTELQGAEALAWAMSATHRDKALLIGRLRDLIEEAGGDCTPREAATRRKVDLIAWCAS